MQRALVSGIALVTFLGFGSGAVAEEPAPPPAPIGAAGRFQRLELPEAGTVTGHVDDHDPEQVVAATVVLTGASVLDAQSRAADLDQTFDAASAERQIGAAQATVLPGLRAAGASIRTTTTTVLNAVTVQVRVKDLTALAAVPGVATVHVSYQIHRFNGTSDVFTGVPSVWTNPGLTGAGMTIGVIDDGIDYYHADFGGSGDPDEWNNDDGTAVEPGTFPTAKVIGGFDFVGDEYDANISGLDTPEPDADPLACGHHGTHVSGTAAGAGVLDDGTTYTGPYDTTTIAGHDWLVAPGAAPEASIRMYKVFGCDGSVNDDVLLDAIEMAVTDGVDVINMSLGSSWGAADEPLAVAIDNATAAGVLSVVSAGNDGPAAYQVGGPSTADTALSVAAIDSSSSTLPGVAITGAVTMSAQNSNAWDFGDSGPITGQLVDVGLGCFPSDFTAAFGKIAVATRGVCDRVDKATSGSTAGALAVIMVNTSAGYPPVEGPIPGGDVPFVGVRSTDGAALVDGATITLDAHAPIANPAFTNFADFTSNGPRQVDSAPKPDISAPGVNILSASVGTGTQGTLLSGTSMASPHTAGIALLVRQAHPTWGPLAIKGAMMSTANPLGIGDYNVLRGGAGLVSAPAAVNTLTYLSTTDGRNSLAFGFRQLTGSYLAARSITINNASNAAITYDMSALVDDLGSNLQVTFSPASVTVAAGSARSVSVSLAIDDPQNLPGADSDVFGELAAITGRVIATPRSSGPGIATLSTTLVLVPYGVSDIRAIGTTASAGLNAPGALDVESIKLANAGVHEGTYDVYQWILSDQAGDAFDPRQPDVRDVGVEQYFDEDAGDVLVVAVSTNNRLSTHVTGEYDVWIDVDDDFEPDYLLLGIDNGLFTSGNPDGQMTAFLLDYSDFSIVDIWSAYAPDNGSIVELPMLVDDVMGDLSTWHFAVDAYTTIANVPADSTDWGSYNPFAEAVSTGAYDVLDAGAGTTLPVFVDSEAVADQAPLGWLVVSVDDTAGAREADRVPLRAREVSRPPT